MSHYNLNPVEEEQVNLKSQSLTEKQLFAQKAGRAFESEATEIETDEEEFSSPSQFSTTSNYWDRAGLRGVVIASVLFLGVSFFALMGQTLINTISSKPEPKKISKQSESVEEEKEDIGALKTNLAIASQKAELQKLNTSLLAQETKPSAAPTPAATPKTAVSPTTPKPIPKSTVKPRTATLTQNPRPTPAIPPVPTVQPKVIYKYVPVRAATASTREQKPSTSKKVASSPVHTANKVGDRQKQPQVSQSKPITAATNSVTAQSTNSDNKDPSQAWEAAARVGIYQESSDTTDSNAKGANGAAGVTAVSSQSQTSSKGDTKSVVDYTTGKNLIIGTHAAGKLETPFFWTSNSNYQNPQSYLIKLTEDLKNADGAVAIPKNALVVAHLKSIAPEGWLEMSAVAIVIKPSGGSEVASSSGVVEKALPEGVILIQAKDGTPLRAEYKSVSRNQSESEVVATTQVVEGDTEANDYSNRVKALEKALKRKRDYQEFSKAENQPEKRASSNSRNKQDNPPSFTILTLDKGSKVQIYVNRNFSL